MVYECEDGIEPIPGCSGAPVIAARLLVGGHEVRWQFETVGIVYARYSDQNNKKQTCAIPIKQEFKQILETVLHPEMHASRAKQMAHVSTIIRDSAEKTAKYKSDGQRYMNLASQGLLEFEAGKTMLNIDLPSGLEKLLGKHIIDIQDSAFLAEVQKRYRITDINIRNKTRTIEELQEDFYNFLKSIRDEDIIELPTRNINSFRISPKGYFRIDIAGSDNGPSVLDVQDNIGYRQYAPPPHNNEPISSKFAIASVPKDQRQIVGKKLAELFIASLTPNSKELLKKASIASKKTKEMIHMWHAYCHKDKWGGNIYYTEDEAYQELKATDHMAHGGTVLEVEDESEKPLDFDNSTKTSSNKAEPEPLSTTTSTSQKKKMEKK